MLTGALAVHRGIADRDRAQARRRSDPAARGRGRIDLPGARARSSHRLLLKDPAARFASASEVAGALRAARENPRPAAARVRANGQGEADRAARAAQIPPRRSPFPDRSAAAKNARAARGVRGRRARPAREATAAAQRSAILAAPRGAAGGRRRRRAISSSRSRAVSSASPPSNSPISPGRPSTDAQRALEAAGLRYHISQEAERDGPARPRSSARPRRRSRASRRGRRSSST